LRIQKGSSMKKSLERGAGLDIIPFWGRQS